MHGKYHSSNIVGARPPWVIQTCCRASEEIQTCCRAPAPWREAQEHKWRRQYPSHPHPPWAGESFWLAEKRVGMGNGRGGREGEWKVWVEFSWSEGFYVDKLYSERKGGGKHCRFWGWIYLQGSEGSLKGCKLIFMKHKSFKVKPVLDTLHMLVYSWP